MRIWLIVLGWAFFHVPLEAKPLRKKSKQALNVSEPSDICLAESGWGYFVVSDEGEVFALRPDGSVRKKSPFRGNDLEGCCVAGGNVYVVDEGNGMVYALDSARLEVVGTFNLNLSQEFNAGIEGIAYNPGTGHFWMVQEKHPTLLFEYDQNFRLISQTKLKHLSDASAIAVYQDQLWVLSDEDHSIVVLDYQGQEQVRYTLHVNNPEGICILPDGTVVVVSDEMNSLFEFVQP
jgi:uncharacterized protein YjiK